MRRNATDFDSQDIEALNVVGSGGGTATPTIHLTLHGKGGVGKSLVASILSQYFRHRGAEIHCVDTDPVNQTFSQYTELGAELKVLPNKGENERFMNGLGQISDFSPIPSLGGKPITGKIAAE